MAKLWFTDKFFVFSSSTWRTTKFMEYISSTLITSFQVIPGPTSCDASRGFFPDAQRSLHWSDWTNRECLTSFHTVLSHISGNHRKITFNASETSFKLVGEKRP